MAWPAVKRGFTQEEFRRYVETLYWSKWRPSAIVWHNTAAPTLKQWMESAAKDSANGKKPGITRISSLENYYKNDRKWSGCPHLFIANDFIWEMNPLTASGVHSPSFNSIGLGIEFIGDYAKEDDDAGEGLRVKNNGILATAVLCSALGLVPRAAIYLHKEDPRTTHDCPGKDMARDKGEMIKQVEALMEAGDHAPDINVNPVGGYSVITTVDNLNVRSGPGVMNTVMGTLSSGIKLEVSDEASNGETKWLRVKTPAGYEGWVAAGFTKGDKT